ncbi:HU family DNA-binding protein [Mesoplasma photuris]|uniref:HU family DNA-binding protein n=1 Tax=Mesoplasma photuris TaxID=217731 RepID=UPI00068AA843|nr:HU family DNA-binding protein [Mesoplasma photuris]
MEIKVLENSNSKKVLKYALIFFLTVFLTSVVITLLLKVINQAVYNEGGLTSDFMMGPMGIITLSIDKVNEAISASTTIPEIAFKLDYAANIYLLAVVPASFFIWAVLSIISVYSRGEKIVISEENEEDAYINYDCGCGCHGACECENEETPVIENVEQPVEHKDVKNPTLDEIIARLQSGQPVIIEEITEEITLIDEEETPVAKQSTKTTTTSPEVEKEVSKPVVKSETIKPIIIPTTENNDSVNSIKKAKKKYPQTSKSEILAMMYDENPEMTKKALHNLVNKTFEIIEKELVQGNEVVIPGFGKLAPKIKEARTGLNPLTGEVLEVPEHTTAKFKPAKALKEAMN